MHLHVLGICGTFMAGVAQLARALGARVTGSDANAWPPMSTQLESAGIEIGRGYDPAHLSPAPDLVVIGNALSRGNAAVEHVLDAGIPYTSGPAWIAREVLAQRPVLAVAGTHGKTTTSSIAAHLLIKAGLRPGYLIGGVSPSLSASASLGAPGAPFVIEADEYDSAFFDKRSKFVHYRPQVLVLNNLEFDHADIFDDLAAIRRQFHHLVRTVPGRGHILSAAGDAELERVLEMGCWSKLTRFGAQRAGPADWRVRARDAGAGTLEFTPPPPAAPATAGWRLRGEHNALNALAAVAAADAMGVPVERACGALASFEGVKRRLEPLGTSGGVTVYDDFAHHPTAIARTLETLRALAGQGRIIALVDCASNTMRMGVHRDTLAGALAQADRALLLRNDGLAWDPEALRRADAASADRISVHADSESLLAACARAARPGDHVVAMSNAAFAGVRERILERLAGGA